MGIQEHYSNIVLAVLQQRIGTMGFRMNEFAYRSLFRIVD